MAKSHLLLWLLLLPALCGPGAGESPQPLLTSFQPGPRCGQVSGPSPPVTEPQLCARRFPTLYIILILKMSELKLREAPGLVQGHTAGGH